MMVLNETARVVSPPVHSVDQPALSSPLLPPCGRQVLGTPPGPREPQVLPSPATDGLRLGGGSTGDGRSLQGGRVSIQYTIFLSICPFML